MGNQIAVARMEWSLGHAVVTIHALAAFELAIALQNETSTVILGREHQGDFGGWKISGSNLEAIAQLGQAICTACGCLKDPGSPALDPIESPRFQTIISTLAVKRSLLVSPRWSPRERSEP
jgi:hypothetical protein